MILTNNGDIAQALDNNSTLERAYKLRVFGRMFDEKKLEKIRSGATINMKKIKFWLLLKLDLTKANRATTERP